MVIEHFNKKLEELTGQNFNFTNPLEVMKFLKNDFFNLVSHLSIKIDNKDVEGEFYGHHPIIKQYSVIQGPIYFGKNVFIGQFSLLRGPLFIDDDVLMGAHAEVARSIIMNNVKIYHKNTVLDSIIGSNTVFGGFSGTCNRSHRKEINVNYKENIYNTNKTFGAIVEKDCIFGTGVILLPGVYVHSEKIVPFPSIVYGNNKHKPTYHSLAKELI